MKRAILAAVSSAFVLPGLGQVLNRQVIKGFLLMMVFTILLITAILTAFFETMDVMRDATVAIDTADTIIDVFVKGLATRDLTGFWAALGLLGAVWLYGVGDAFFYGLRYKPSEEEK
jgi:TM2 domain-containing membrane protein YozV